MPLDFSRRPTVSGILVAGLGVALFVYFLQRAGIGDVGDGIRRLGWVFLAVVALGGIRFAVRAAAWITCLDGPHRLTLWQVFQAVVAGDSLGNLTPLSIIVSEPAKAMFLRHREPLRRTLPALAVENLFYTLSGILVIAVGFVTSVLMFQTSGQLWLMTSAAVAAMVILIGVAHALIWSNVRVGRATLGWLDRHGLAPPAMKRASARVTEIEDHIHALYPRDPRRLVSLAFLEFSFHVLAILEIYIILSVISDQPPTILHAFVLESTNRFISFAFRFVPLRLGVDEAGSGMFAELLAFGTVTGVTLAIIRKGRNLVWMTIGVLITVRRGLSVKQILGAGTSQVAVVVMARSPMAGEPPKTRLATVVTDADNRRRLYAAFLRDTIAACRSLEGTSLRLAHTPDGGTAGFAEMGITPGELLVQRGNDLGARESGVFADLFAAGFRKVLMVGSDLPTVPLDHIRRALDTLDTRTVVLGPSEDGGYYLMGLATTASTDEVPDLFTEIRWSTSSALDDTRAAAARSGLRVELVPSWYDVDDEAGLTRLCAELANQEGQARAPETARVLREILTSPSDPPSLCAS
jgi:hypothetical protein